MIESVFSTDIYSTKFDNLEKLKNLCTPNVLSLLCLEKNYGAAEGNILSSVNTWKKDNSCKMPHVMEEFKELVNFIEYHAKIYWDHLEYVNYITPKVAQSWINVSEPNSSVGTHSHIKYPLVAVIYLQASLGHGNLILLNPLDAVLGSTPVPSRNNKVFQISKQVSTGDLILFPGYLSHYVTANTDQSQRIVLSANLNETGEFHYTQKLENDNLARKNKS